jgi:hypothetical protein
MKNPQEKRLAPLSYEDAPLIMHWRWDVRRSGIVREIPLVTRPPGLKTDGDCLIAD